MPSEVVVILQTYQRTDYALETVRAMIVNCRYQPLSWYVCDDGSEPAHVDAILNALQDQRVIGYHSQRLGPGKSFNLAWRSAHRVSDITLWLEDDWALSRPLEISHYVQLLEERLDVGMVRLSNLPAGLASVSVGHNDTHYLLLDWSSPYCFSGHPSIRHRRAFEAWGPYPEGFSPGDTEVVYDDRVRERKGPRIIWPVECGGWGPFAHIGKVKSYVP